MSYNIHQVLRACLDYGMTESQRDHFEVLLRFPHTDDAVQTHTNYTDNLYIKLRDMGLDDNQVLSVLEAIK